MSDEPTRSADDTLPAMSAGVSGTPPPGQTVREGSGNKPEPPDSRWRVGDAIEDPETGTARWEVREIKNNGGMGIVNIVYDRATEEVYAAKTFKDDVFAKHPSVAERFKREVFNWVNLHLYEHLVGVRFAKTIRGKPFVFLEYVRGGDLTAWIGTPRLTENLPQVVRFAIHLCDAMIYVNSQGIKVHRDLKPQNCLVDEGPVLKLTDFGLSKVFDDAPDMLPDAPVAPGNLQVTVGGTLPYMPPEQFDGRNDIDGRADVYSFGVMLFEMIKGELPFRVEGRTQREIWDEYKQAHRSKPPPTVNSSVLALDVLIQTCLAKDPNDRFADFGVVRKRLAEIYEALSLSTSEREELNTRRRDAEKHFVEALKIHPSYKQASEQERQRMMADVLFDNTYRGLIGQPQPFFAYMGNTKRTNESTILVETYIELGRADYAITYCDAALADIEGEIRRTTRAATGASARGFNDEAERLDGDRVTFWTLKGLALDSAGRIEEAVRLYDDALKLQPTGSFSAWRSGCGVASVTYLKACSLTKLHQYEDALACFDRSIGLDSQVLLAWGRIRQVLDCIDHCISIDPSNTDPLRLKATVLQVLDGREKVVAASTSTSGKPDEADAKRPGKVAVTQPTNALRYTIWSVGFGLLISAAWLAPSWRQGIVNVLAMTTVGGLCFPGVVRGNRISHWFTIPAIIAGFLAHGILFGTTGLESSIAAFALWFGFTCVAILVASGSLQKETDFMVFVTAFYIVGAVIGKKVLITFFLWFGLIVVSTFAESAVRALTKRSAARRAVPGLVLLALATWMTVVFEKALVADSLSGYW